MTENGLVFLFLRNKFGLQLHGKETMAPPIETCWSRKNVVPILVNTNCRHGHVKYSVLKCKCSCSTHSVKKNSGILGFNNRVVISPLSDSSAAGRGGTSNRCCSGAQILLHSNNLECCWLQGGNPPLARRLQMEAASRVLRLCYLSETHSFNITSRSWLLFEASLPEVVLLN